MKPLQQSNEVSTNEISLFDASSVVCNSEDLHTKSLAEDEFLKYANKNGVMTRPIWKLMNKLEMFKDAQCGDLPNADWLEERVVNVPSSVIK